MPVPTRTGAPRLSISRRLTDRAPRRSPSHGHFRRVVAQTSFDRVIPEDGSHGDSGGEAEAIGGRPRSRQGKRVAVAAALVQTEDGGPVPERHDEVRQTVGGVKR